MSCKISFHVEGLEHHTPMLAAGWPLPRGEGGEASLKQRHEGIVMSMDMWFPGDPVAKTALLARGPGLDSIVRE